MMRCRQRGRRTAGSPTPILVTLLLLPLMLPLTACAPDDNAGGEPAEPWFVDEARERGLDFTHRSGYVPGALPLLPEIVGGGAALVDVDGDGDLDAYLVQAGWRLDGSDADAPSDTLFVNRGDGRFEPRPQAERGYGMGVAAGDYDGDGDIDLYVTNVGANALLSNDGSGHFEDVAGVAGVDDPGWGTAAAFLDLDADGDLDLFLVNYIDWSLAIEKDCHSRGSPTYCAPTTYAAPAMDRLFRNDGDGTFTDVSVSAGLAQGRGNGLGLGAADFNDDGLVDLFVANDKTVNRLWLNKGGLRFEDAAAAWGCAVDDHGGAKAGMGVAVADMDDDGDADVLVVNLEGETDSYHRNDGGYFTDRTAQAGLTVHGRRHTRFGVIAQDFDNDGWLDIYQANGKVDGDLNAATDPFAEPNLLYRGRARDSGIRFSPARPRAGTTAPLIHTSRAAAVGDVDNDGRLDILVVNRDSPAYLLMNRTAAGNWTRFRLLDSQGADVPGAVVLAMVGSRRIRRDAAPSSSYLAAHDPRVQIGLGEFRFARDVAVRWPGGTVERFGDFAAGTSAVLARGKGAAANATAGVENSP